MQGSGCGLLQAERFSTRSGQVAVKRLSAIVEGLSILTVFPLQQCGSLVAYDARCTLHLGLLQPRCTSSEAPRSLIEIHVRFLALIEGQ